MVAKVDQKSWLGAVLKKLWDSLGDGSSDYQRRLGKHGNYEELQKRLKEKTDQLRDLKTELFDHVDADTVKEWETKRKQALDELNVAVAKTEKFIGEVKEVRNQSSEAGRVARAAESYQVKKLGDSLTDEPGSLGNTFAKTVASLLRKSMEQDFIVTEEGKMDYLKPMVFQSHSTAGGKVHGILDSYIAKSTMKLEDCAQASRITWTSATRRMAARS